MPGKRLQVVYFAFFGRVRLQCLLSADWLNKHVFIVCLMMLVIELLQLNVILNDSERYIDILTCGFISAAFVLMGLLLN